MSNSMLATVVIAGVVGASSAAVTGAMLSPSNSGEEVREVATKAELAGVDFAAEFAALRKQNVEFSNRIMDLEMGASLAGANTEKREPVALEADPELEAMRVELAALLSTMKGSSDEIPATFTETVGTALASIRAEEEAERDQRRQERRAERTETRLAELAEKLGLNPTQVNDLRDHTLATEEKRQALFAEARELGDFGSMRETMRTMRDESNAALQTIFSPAQYQQYQDENLGGGFGGGGRRGGGGGSTAAPTSGGGGGRRGGGGF